MNFVLDIHASCLHFPFRLHGDGQPMEKAITDGEHLGEKRFRVAPMHHHPE